MKKHTKFSKVMKESFFHKITLLQSILTGFGKLWDAAKLWTTCSKF